MIFVWKGKGFLVFVIMGICLLITNALFDDSVHHRALGFLLAAIPNWLIGRYLNKNAKKTFVDESTQEKITVDMSHSFFFINMEWWSLGLIMLGIFAYIAGN